MKTVKTIVVLCLMLSLLFGCGKKEEVPMQMGNPWKEYASLAEAEDAVGFTLDLPEDVGGYEATTFRVMGGALLEVTYQKGDTQVVVRKQAGEGEDLSGVYETFRDVSSFDYFDGVITQKRRRDCHVMLIDKGGYSHSFYFPTEWVEEYTAFIDVMFEG